ncbi:hypothetical protein VIGAN_05241100, partial [Vigna angularis var. angularis]
MKLQHADFIGWIETQASTTLPAHHASSIGHHTWNVTLIWKEAHVERKKEAPPVQQHGDKVSAWSKNAAATGRKRCFERCSSPHLGRSSNSRPAWSKL